MSNAAERSLLSRLLAVRGTVKFAYITMLISAVLSLIASFVLSVQAFELAQDPDAVLSCDVNAVLSCGAVARSWQAQVLGFPNAYLGLIAESVIITLAAGALAGAKYSRWFLLGAQGVYTIGLGFAYWLFYQSMFDIGSLCPWCLLITVSTTVVFANITRINVLEGNLPVPTGLRQRIEGFYKSQYDLLVLLTVLTVLAIGVILKYGPGLFA